MKCIVHWLLLLSSLVFAEASLAKLVKYDLTVDHKTVNFTGKQVNTIAINDQIPAPTISATVGDTLQVTVHNKLPEDTSIHWHGVLLPNDQDGVPYLTTPPIKPNTSFTYRYKITHAGTYWYHSHSGLQEQRGLYGSLVFHPKEGERVPADKEEVIVLSDWTNEHPKQVLANIKKDGDYYALKKDSVQSWLKVLQHGTPAIKSRLQGSWTRMGPMDISDVGYDAFLANGKRSQVLKGKPGEKIRLRLINAAASSYFYVEFSGSPMLVVAADGVDVEPIKVQRLRLAIAETYDIIVTIPKHGLYELRATSEDGTGYSSTFIGQGTEKIFANDVPKPNLFVMDHSMHGSENHAQHMEHNQQAKQQAHQGHHPSHHQGHHGSHHGGHHGNHQQHQYQSLPTIAKMTDYRALRAVSNTTLPHNAPTKEVKLNLTGNMERYVWSFNNITLKESDPIRIRKGENVKIFLDNKTMMHHPMHLHGHFFRVLNGQKERSPLKHTVNVPPMEKVEIEFEANEKKDWFFHCHNLYHMMSGMTRVFAYDGTSQYTDELKAKISHDPWYHSLDVAFLSNMSLGELRVSNAKNAFEVEYDTDYDKEYDIDVIYLRTLTRFLDLYIGGSFEKETHEKGENTAIAGFRYVLPMLLDFEFRVDHEGHLRAQLGSELQLSDRAQFEWFYNTDKEYQTTLLYELTKFFLLTSTYDSDHHWGGGFRLRL